MKATHYQTHRDITVSIKTETIPIMTIETIKILWAFMLIFQQGWNMKLPF